MTDRLLTYIAVALLAVILCAVEADAQTAPLAPGTVGSVALYNPNNGQPLGTCPGVFWSPAAPANPAVCYSATMTCSNQTTTPNLGLIYSYVVPPSQVLLGTVVLFAGGPRGAKRCRGA